MDTTDTMTARPRSMLINDVYGLSLWLDDVVE